MLGDLMMKRLNELRLKNVQCDLELVSCDNKTYDIHQIVFTALNQKHFLLAVQHAYSSDIRCLSKKKMYLSHLSSSELQLLIEFMYGVLVTKKREYDLLLSALEKLDMTYLLDEVGGFTFDDSPIKTEVDQQTEDIEDALNDNGKVQSTNEIPTSGSTCIYTVTDDVSSSVDIVNLPPSEKCSVKEEPDEFRSEPPLWAVQQSTCNQRSNSETDILTNEESENCRKRLGSASDNINESLLQDLKEELESDSETVKNDLDMNEVERVYQKVKESLNYSVSSEAPTVTGIELSSELDKMDKSTFEISSKSCDNLNVEPCNSIASALLESTNKFSNTSNQAETSTVSISVISTSEPDVGTCTNPAAETSNLSSDIPELATSGLCVHSVSTINSGSFDASVSHSGIEVITDSVIKSGSLFTPSENAAVTSQGKLTLCESGMTSIPASLSGLTITDSIDCHNTESSALFLKSVPSSSCENQMFPRGSVQSYASAVKSSIMCATISTIDNERQVSTLPVDVYNAKKQTDSVSNAPLEEILSKTVQVSEVENATKPVVAGKGADELNKKYGPKEAMDWLPVKLSIKQAVTNEVNDVSDLIGPTEQIGDGVNCVSENVRHQCTNDLNEELNQTKDHSFSEEDIEAGHKIIENQTGELECQSKLVINEDQDIDDLNNETMQVNQNVIVSELDGTVHENQSSDEMPATTNQVVTKCINQNISETCSFTCVAKLSTQVQSSSASTVSQTDFRNNVKSRSKSETEAAKLSCNIGLSTTNTETSRTLTNTNATTSKLMNDTCVTYTSKTTLCTDFNAVLSNRLKQNLLLPKATTSSDVSYDYCNRKTTEVKPASAEQKSKRKSLFKKESKRSKIGTENPVLADILNCKRNENVYSQIKELEFEKIDGTSPSDLSECDVLTENATAFLKMSHQNIDTCTGSQMNTLGSSQTNQNVTSIGDVGSVDNIKELKEKVKNQFGKSVKRKAVPDCNTDNNLVIDDVIDIDDESSEVVVRSPSSMKKFNNKQLNFLAQTESVINSSSDECIIPVSEVLTLTPALVCNSVINKSGKLKGNERVQINTERGKSDSAANSRATDETSVELKADSVSDVRVQSSEVLNKDLKCTDQVNSSKTAASNADTLKNVPTVNVYPIQKVTNQTNSIRQQCAILPKVPVTMIRFPLRILSHSIQTGKHIIQVEHPTITSTSISPRYSVSLLPKTDEKFARKRWQSTPDTDLLRKRKSVDESVILENLKANNSVNMSDIKKRKYENSNQIETMHGSALDSDINGSVPVVTDLTEDTTNSVSGMALNMKGNDELQNKHEDDVGEASLDDVPLSALRVKLFDEPSTSNFKLTDATNLTNTTNNKQCNKQSSVASNSNNHLSVPVINEPEQEAEMEVVLDIKDDPDCDNRTIDSRKELKASLKEGFNAMKDKKCLNNGGDELKVKLFTNATNRRKTSDEVKSSSSNFTANDVIQTKVVLKPPVLKSCRTNLSELRKQIATQRARTSRLNHKMVLVNGKQAAKRRSHTRSKNGVYDLDFKSEPSHNNIQSVAIAPSSVLVFGKTSANTTVNPKCAISTCSKSTTVLSNTLNSPRPSTDQTPVTSTCDLPVNTVASTASITPPSFVEPLTLSSWSTKPTSKNYLSPIFTPLPIPSLPAVSGSSSSQIVLLSSSLKTLPSVSIKSHTSIETVKKSPTPVLSSMLLSRPLNHIQGHNCDETRFNDKKTRKYKKKNTSEKSDDNSKKKRVRLSKKQKVDSLICNPVSYVIKAIDTPPHTVSSNSPYRQILPKPPCVALVRNPTFNQVNE